MVGLGHSDTGLIPEKLTEYQFKVCPSRYIFVRIGMIRDRLLNGFPGNHLDVYSYRISICTISTLCSLESLSPTFY